VLKLRVFDRCDRLASSSEFFLGATATVRKKKPIPFCAHDQQLTLELWLIHPSLNLYKAGSLFGTNTHVGKRALFQQETCNTAIMFKSRLSCAHSWWSRQSQYCPVTRFRDAGMPLFDRCTHFHIPIWLAFRGYNRTICEIGLSSMWGGETPPLPAGPHEIERAL
jgi:hypothetical protein